MTPCFFRAIEEGKRKRFRWTPTRPASEERRSRRKRDEGAGKLEPLPARQHAHKKKGTRGHHQGGKKGERKEKRKEEAVPMGNEKGGKER